MWHTLHRAGSVETTWRAISVVCALLCVYGFDPVTPRARFAYIAFISHVHRIKLIFAPNPAQTGYLWRIRLDKWFISVKDETKSIIFAYLYKYNTKYFFSIVEYMHGRTNRLFYLARTGPIRCMELTMLLVLLLCGLSGGMLSMPVVCAYRALGE